MSAILSAAGELVLEARTAEDADCCVFAARVIRRATGRDPERRAAWLELAHVHPDLPGGRVSAARAWGPVLAAVEIGAALEAFTPPTSPRLKVGRWHVCQGWATTDPDGGFTPSDGDRGHTWLWYACTLTHGIAVDSTRARGPLVEGVRPWGFKADRYIRGGHKGIAVGILDVS